MWGQFFCEYGDERKIVFQIYQTLCTVLSHTYLLTYLVQKLGTKRMRSMHSAQDCRNKFYSKGHITNFFADIYDTIKLK